jgi:O-antigen/teichoic acid export membrane protein
MRLLTDNIITAISSKSVKNKKFFNALILGTISAITNQGLNFITIILITRQLGDVNMGHFSLVQSMVTMFVTFGILGQNISATTLTSRFKNGDSDHLGLVIGNAIILSAFMAAVIGFFILLTSNYFFSDININSSSTFLTCILMILWLLGMTFDMLQTSTLIGLEAYGDLLKTDILKGVFSISVILPLAMKFGIFGAITGYVISSFIGIFLNQWFIRKNLKKINCKIDFRLKIYILKEILGVGLPIFIAALFISFSTWFTNRLIFNSLNGPAALGIVFICRQILILLQFIPSQISRVLLPLIAENKNTKEEIDIKKISLLLSIGISIFLAAGGLVFENFVLKIYNLDPAASILPYRIILLTVLFSTTNMILGQFVIAGRDPWFRTYADIVISLVLIIFTLILIPLNVYLTLPVAIISSFIVSDIFLIWYIWSSYNKRKAIK